MGQRWKNAPPGAHWGEFGPDDQRGRMNLVTPAKVMQGIAEVREGRTFCLSLPLDVPGGQVMNPRRIAPRRYAVLRDGKSAGQQGFCWSYDGEDAELTDVVTHRAEPEVVLRSCAGASTTNVAFGGPKRKSLYVTESVTGGVLRAELDVPGLPIRRPAAEATVRR